MIACVRIKAPLVEKSRGLPAWLFRRIQEYINAHLDSALSVEELATSAGLSASHFSRSFVKSVGVRPHVYVVRRRVLRAQQLLAQTDLNLAEIALATGFSDQSHFCRRFRQLVGLPPGAFRARHR
jgi:AraC family transcriptional regulator